MRQSSVIHFYRDFTRGPDSRRTPITQSCNQKLNRGGEQFQPLSHSIPHLRRPLSTLSSFVFSSTNFMVGLRAGWFDRKLSSFAGFLQGCKWLALVSLNIMEPG